MDTQAKRGRPTTGNAMTAAERKAQSRAQARAAYLDGETASIPTTALIEMLGEWVANGKTIFVREITDELIKRTQENQPG